MGREGGGAIASARGIRLLPGFAPVAPIAAPRAVTASQRISDRPTHLSIESVRTVVGFRARTSALGLALPEKRQDFSRHLNLGQLGVVPGQVLELYFEARDFNPDRTGIGGSDIVRIEPNPCSRSAAVSAAQTVRMRTLRLISVT